MKTPEYKKLAVTFLISAAVLVSCSDNDNEGSATTSPSDDAPTSVSGDAPSAVLDDAALKQLEGVWDRRGYGDVYEFDGNRTTWYAVNESTCLTVTSFAGLAGIDPANIDQARYDLLGEQLVLALPGEPFAMRLERLDALPERCSDTVASDAQGAFDYLWATFDEYYAFFELHGVDWASVYANQVSRVGDATDNAELFNLLSDMLAPIDDGHVFLTNGDEFYSPAVERGAFAELQRSFEAQSDITDFEVWLDTVFQQFRQVITSLLDSGSISENGPLIWGTAKGGSTGYLFIESMAGYVIGADGEADEDVSSVADLAAATNAMDQALADLADTDHLIIDVRLNGGGFDAISFDFASRFVSERQLAFSKSARSRDYESVPVEGWLEPLSEGAYLNDVTLIVGADTASAAEIFSIPMQHLPQVTVIGEPTAGALSDILIKPLPNGWVAGLSNEVYRDVNGVSLEGIGVVPDIDVPVFRLEDIQAGIDPALERALAK